MDEPATKQFFVDEAGDLTLFDKHGRVIIGQEGVSRCFLVGLADLPNPLQAEEKLSALRAELLADPYFYGVPSFQPERRKTAICFHAKDDLPEVRREVFKLLPSFNAKIIIAFRRKNILAAQASEMYQKWNRKLQPNVIYDDLVSRIFRDKLHRAHENHIIFAHRGNALRKAALEDAIIRAKRNFELRWKQKYDLPTFISSAYPSQSAGLQVVDYYLWAVQRLLERGEERFFEALAPHYRLIMDLDDKREKQYGAWYSDTNKFELAKIMPVAS